MQEWHPVEKTDQENIEERLRTYYGPALPEQPLPSSSWQRVNSQLGRRRVPGRRYLPPWLSRRYQGKHTLPPYIQHAFQRIAGEAHMALPLDAVSCAFKSRVSVPTLHVSWLRRPAITLALPTSIEQSLAPSELDFLAASGLARYACVRQFSYIRTRLLLTGTFPLLVIGAAVGMFWWRHMPLIIVLLSVVLCGLCLTIFWALGLQARAMARRADVLMVRWIGRDRACRGLRSLAARSRNPSRRRWNDLSLTERIQSICSTPVALEEERYTLAR